MGLCLVVVPLQLGARAMAFPRMAMAGLWAWLGGAVLCDIALVNDGGSAGLESDMVGLYIASQGLMAIGLVASAGALVTSILTTRAPGMTMRRIPFFSWSALVFGLGLILMLPVLVGTLIYLFVDHRYGSREAFGGNLGSLAWAGWVVTQPATFLFAIPAVGVFADLMPGAVGKRTPARGVTFAGLSLVGVAALAGITQQNIQSLPLPGEGIDTDELGDIFRDFVPYALFNALPVLGALIVFVMALVLAKPDKNVEARGNPALAFAFFGYAMVLLGMVGNILYATDDLALQGTIFEEATLMFVVYGGVLGIFGGIANWSPKWRGGAPSSGAVVILSLLGLVGTILATVPHYVAGFLDQPAGFTYDDSDLQIWNVLVVVGHALFGLMVLGFALLILRVRPGDDDEANPWGGQTAEWLSASPAPESNFDELVLVGSAEPVYDAERELEGSDA
jgi:cytochrome o ubiquinol oxidase subunit 1